MEIMNYSTQIAVSKSVGDVTGALTRRGVTRISTIFDDDGTPAGLGFSMKTEYGIRDFELPVRTDGVLAALKLDTRTSGSQRTPEHAARVAWRIAFDWLKAQSALIDAQLASLDEVMLPYMVARYDKNGVGITAYQQYTDNQKQLEK